jgi:ribosomal protein S8
LQPDIELASFQTQRGHRPILKQEGYLADCGVEGPRHPDRLKLKFQGRKGVIAGSVGVSRPGLRRYVGSQEVPRVSGRLGVAILSTPRGVMTGTERAGRMSAVNSSVTSGNPGILMSRIGRMPVPIPAKVKVNSRAAGPFVVEGPKGQARFRTAQANPASVIDTIT